MVGGCGGLESTAEDCDEGGKDNWEEVSSRVVVSSEVAEREAGGGLQVVVGWRGGEPRDEGIGDGGGVGMDYGEVREGREVGENGHRGVADLGELVEGVGVGGGEVGMGVGGIESCLEGREPVVRKEVSLESLVGEIGEGDGA